MSKFKRDVWTGMMTTAGIKSCLKSGGDLGKVNSKTTDNPLFLKQRYCQGALMATIELFNLYQSGAMSIPYVFCPDLLTIYLNGNNDFILYPYRLYRVVYYMNQCGWTESMFNVITYERWCQLSFEK